MKLRQKLAMVLAASMIATAMPVVTMAESTNKVVSGIQIAEKNGTVSNFVRVEMKDPEPGTATFYVNIENAEFPAATTTGSVIVFAGTGTGTWERVNKTELKVEFTGGNASTKFQVPLNVKLTGGDATVAIDGNRSVISDMSPVVFARTNDGNATVTVETAETINTGDSTVAKIIIDEIFAGSIANNNKDIKFESRHADYDIVGATVKYERGFANSNTVTYTSSSAAISDGVFTLTPAATAGSSTGRISVVLTVRNTVKKPSTGDLSIKVTGSDVTTTTVKVAEVKEYGTEIVMDNKKVVDIVAGQTEDVTFTIKETVPDTFVANREFDVEFDKGFLIPYKVSDSARLTQAKNTLSTFFGGTLGNAADGTFEYVDVILDDKDEYVVGVTFKLLATAANSSDKTELEIKDLPVYVPLNYSGDIKVTASGRALAEDASIVAVNAKKAITVTAEPITVKVGLKEQSGGKIVIQEEDADIIEQGEWIYVKISDDYLDGLYFKDEDFDKNGKIEVTSGDLLLDLGATEVNSAGILRIKVKRSSTVASTITIKDLSVYSDRTVPQGTYDIKVGGYALSQEWTRTAGAIAKASTSTTKDIKVAAFINVATPNTEDITSNGLKKGTASFTIGSGKYVVNGVEAQMDGAPYIDNGRTMVPVRYVANALGVSASDIYFASGTATIIAGNKTVSLTIGDKVAKLNGVPAKTMETAPVVKDGRTYVPVSEIGSLLGVEAKWDAATQTASFTNN